MKSFISRKQFGQLLLGWFVIMAAVFPWDLLKIANVVSIRQLGAAILRSLFVSIFAIWLAIRHAKGQTQVEGKDIFIYGLVWALCFLLFRESTISGTFWSFCDLHKHIFGADLWDRLVYYYGEIHWEPKWLSVCFLNTAYFDFWPVFSLLIEYGVYGVVKAICIKHNQKQGAVVSIVEHDN